MRSHTSLWQKAVAGTRSDGNLDLNHSNLKCFECRHATHLFGGNVPAHIETISLLHSTNLLFNMAQGHVFVSSRCTCLRCQVVYAGFVVIGSDFSVRVEPLNG